MAQQGSGPAWQFDQTRQLYYYYDSRNGQYVWRDRNGSQLATQATPRNTPFGQAYPDAHDAPSLSGSPTGNQYQLHTAMRGLNINQTPQPSASSRQFVSEGRQYVEEQNSENFVHSLFATGPAEKITDPVLYSGGVRAYQALYGSGEEHAEVLYPQYRVKSHEFFVVGRVFMVLWAEPAGETSGGGSLVSLTIPSDRSITEGILGERVYSKVRRFVVIKQSRDYCSALPILTYGGRGVSKSGVKKSDHAIIYTGRDAPRAHPRENPLRGGEEGMRPNAIRVVPDDPAEALDPMSRIDFNKVHTIQHNIKVRPFGNVHPNSAAALATQFRNVWSQTPAQSSTTRAHGTNSSMATASSPRAPVEDEDAEVEEEDDDDDEGNADDAGIDSQDAEADREAGVGSEQDTWPARVQQARNALTRMMNQGYTREQAFAIMVDQRVKQGLSKSAADTQIRGLLSGKRP